MRRIVTFRAVERDPLLAAVVASAVLAGVLLRIWILTSPLGALDADEAVVGLMARHVLDGQIPVFFWGQQYGGSQEALLTAPVFAVSGQSVLALKLVVVALHALGAALVWRVGKRALGEPAAALAGVTAWIWPPFALWWSTKERGFYGVALVCVLLAVLFVFRLRERESRLDAALLGLAVGVGFWATALTLPFAGAAVLWLVWARPHVVRLSWAVVAGALAGVAPWLGWNVSHDWQGIAPGSFVTRHLSYTQRVREFFENVLPSWLGFHVPYAPQWLLARPVAVVGYLVLAGAFVVVARRCGRLLAPLLAGVAVFPFVYAATGFGTYREPRYLALLLPAAALLTGRLLALRRWLAPVGVALLVVFTTVGLVRMESWGLYKPRAPDVAVPDDVGPAVALLDRYGIRRVKGDYWLTYRIAFASHERVIVATPYTQRNGRWERLVAALPKPPWIFLRGSRTEVEARPLLTTRGYRRIESGDYVLYVPPSA